MSDHKNTSGLLFRLGMSTTGWGSKKQEIVALSMTEAEYVASIAATCPIVWLRRILQNCEHEIMKPTKLWCGNLYISNCSSKKSYTPWKD